LRLHWTGRPVIARYQCSPIANRNAARPICLGRSRRGSSSEVLRVEVVLYRTRSGTGTSEKWGVALVTPFVSETATAHFAPWTLGRLLRHYSRIPRLGPDHTDRPEPRPSGPGVTSECTLLQLSPRWYLAALPCSPHLRWHRRTLWTSPRSSTARLRNHPIDAPLGHSGFWWRYWTRTRVDRRQPGAPKAALGCESSGWSWWAILASHRWGRKRRQRPGNQQPPFGGASGGHRLAGEHRHDLRTWKSGNPSETTIPVGSAGWKSAVIIHAVCNPGTCP